MEISTIDVILIISILINFTLLKRVSNREDTTVLLEKINKLEHNLKMYELKNEKYIENIYFHNESLSNSIIYHLHASGTANIDKIWETYHSEVKDEWPEDKEWPNYLPLEGNPENRYPKINLEEYNQWLSMTKNNSYLKYPSEIINHEYIWKMK